MAWLFEMGTSFEHLHRDRPIGFPTSNAGSNQRPPVGCHLPPFLCAIKVLQQQQRTQADQSGGNTSAHTTASFCVNGRSSSGGFWELRAVAGPLCGWGRFTGGVLADLAVRGVGAGAGCCHGGFETSGPAILSIGTAEAASRAVWACLRWRAARTCSSLIRVDLGTFRLERIVSSLDCALDRVFCNRTLSSDLDCACQLLVFHCVDKKSLVIVDFQNAWRPGTQLFLGCARLL